MRDAFLFFVSSIFLISHAMAEPVISEFMADNESTAADEDGAFSDWIEIHNPDSAPVALLNWALTDKAGDLDQWKFPDVTLAPGEFLVVWASNKNRRVPGAPLHTNFALAKGGEFLALVRPDGTTAHSFSPSFPVQAGDESHGLRFHSSTLLAADAAGRYLIPSSASAPGPAWNETTFADTTWSPGKGGFGFGITVPGITVRQVSKNGAVTGLADALELLTRPPGDAGVLSSTTSLSATVNLLGDGADGHYELNALPPGKGGDNYVIEATGFVTIPTAGIYTFGLNSDDGGRILIDGMEILRDDSFHAARDTFGTLPLSAGQHSFQLVMFEGGGGDSVEFFAAAGTRSTFDASVFRLVGDVANGGLAATTTPPGSGGWIGTDLKAAMTGRTGVHLRLPFTTTVPVAATSMSLVMRYNDGFSAWLNGAPVASANAPESPAWNSVATASRTNAASLRKQGFNLTASLPALANGSNLLALHALNASAADPSFLAIPEIVIGSLKAAEAPANYGNGLATPGWINGAPSSLGKVADPQFSVKRGFFTAPIQVAISTATPAATLRYTTDGSTPDETNGRVYTGPLTIAATTVLRARALLDGWESTDVDTQTYLFPDDIIRQSPDGSPAPGWPATSGTAQVLDHGMDPTIVNHSNPDIGGPATVKAALLSLPSISVTTDLANLLNIGGSQGIYSNPDGRGFAWERPASMEWIDPPDAAHPHGTGAFQINAGVRLRGGFSRSTSNPKHAFRFFFRAEYGDTKLRYPLFGRNAAQEFDKIDLRTSQNYSWSFEGGAQNTFLREESARQAMLDMGQPGSHVRYVHLYLNGRYWGLYDLDERTEAAFAETYLGGDKDDYDVVKSEQEEGYKIGATDGTLAAWQDLWNKGKAHRASPTPANYFRMLGLAADGVTPTEDPVLLDADNLIDYLLLTFWSGNLDGCVSSFANNQTANNWFGSRRRDGNTRQGFKFFVHDFEHSLFSVSEDRTGPFTTVNEANFAYSNPLFLHQDLAANPEYRMRWADHIQRHLFNNGALTPAAWQNRINRLATTVDAAIAAESARWGDAKREPPRTRQDWIAAQNAIISYLTPRAPVVLNQLRADGLYPNLDAPVLIPSGGYQPDGVEITVQAPAGGTVYYLPDGRDPRAIGGGLRAGAQIHTSTTTSSFLIPWSASAWKYLGTGVNLGTAWRADAFNDSAWPTGTAELGYGDGDEATVIPITDISSAAGIQKPATCYFRRTFNVANTSGISALALTVEYDDAYAVYLNGTRIAGNLPVNAAYNHYSGTAIEDTVETLSIPAALLRAGSNTIAVEVHQVSDSSSDLSLNLSLAAIRSTTATPMILQGSGPRTLRLRALSGSTWSALAESTYQIGTAAPTAANLVISEISYFPQSPHEDAEFIELLNTGSTTLDLAGARFTEGIDFTFPAGTTLAVGGRVLVVENIAAFEALHGPGKPIAGIFQNGTGLANTGERLKLETADGAPLLDFTYGTDFPWPASANGLGRSLILTDPAAPENPHSWRPSALHGGNPGTTDYIPRTAGQGLLDYAIPQPAPTLDTAGIFSAVRRLGADDAALTPEWSTDLGSWFIHSLTPISETPDSSGNSTLTWKLDPLPAGRVFMRLRVAEKL